MPVYAIAQLTITDRAVYDRYAARFRSIFGRFQGHLLAADESPEVVEGSWSHQKVVLLEFPDEAAFRDWLESPAYQAIVKERHASSNGVVLLVKGIS
jgi:uncharacterized protein (DUF1330 family)